METYNGVEDTLFIPLAGRIYGSKYFKNYFYDEKTMSLEKFIPSSVIIENSNEYFMLASISRYYEMDLIVKDFLSKNPKGNVVYLGCGLETAYFRLNNNEATFYEIDMPNVIELRHNMLGDNENEILIGSDLLDYSWMDKIDNKKPTLFVAAGVFQYFKEAQVNDLFSNLKTKFQDGEILFDATNKTGLKRSNRYVQKTGNNNAMMYFYIDDLKQFCKTLDVKLLSSTGFFANALRILKHQLKLSTKIIAYFGDKGGYSKLIHIKFS